MGSAGVGGGVAGSGVGSVRAVFFFFFLIFFFVVVVVIVAGSITGDAPSPPSSGAAEGTTGIPVGVAVVAPSGGAATAQGGAAALSDRACWPAAPAAAAPAA